MQLHMGFLEGAAPQVWLPGLICGLRYRSCGSRIRPPTTHLHYQSLAPPLCHRPVARCWLESLAGSGGSVQLSLASSNDGPNRHLHMRLSPPQRTAFIAGLCAASAELFSRGETTDYRHCSEESAGSNKWMFDGRTLPPMCTLASQMQQHHDGSE
jgi:hypothetical protein